MAAPNEKILRDAFQEFDKDKNGTIDLKELKSVIKQYFKLAKVKADDKKVKEVATEIMKAYDKSGDGKLSLDEFIRAFKG